MNGAESTPKKNPFRDLDWPVIVLICSVVGTGYVGHYRLGKVEEQLHNHANTAAHPAAASDLRVLELELNYLSKRIDKLEKQ